MRQYVVRRAFEHKQYRGVVEDMGWDDGVVEWLKKLSRDEIDNPGADRIEKLYRHYKLLETKKRRAA